MSERTRRGRCLMMRLWRSLYDGEEFYHRAFVVEAELFLLVKLGWVEARGNGYRLTRRGVRAWWHFVDSMPKQSAQRDILRSIEIWLDTQEKTG